MNLTHRSRLLTRIAVLLLLSLSCALTPQAARAALIPVDTVDYGIVVDGECSLVEAILAANSNARQDTCPAGDSSESDTIVLVGDTTYALTAYYGFYEGETALPQITSAMVISGNNATIARQGSEEYRLFHVAMGGDLTLTHLTLQSGLVAGNGGAIHNDGKLTVAHSRILSNRATNEGGGIYSDHESISVILDTQFRLNRALNGGGFADLNAHNTITTSEFSDNIAEMNGGGLANTGTLLFTGSKVISNSAALVGGGIHNGGTLHVNESNFTANQAEQFGGAINNDYTGSAILINSAFISNTAVIAGAGFANFGSAHLYGMEVVANISEGGGGGIATGFRSSTSINTSHINSNRANYGAAVSNTGSLTIRDSQILSNIATTGRGGALYNNADYSTTASFYRTQLTANSAIVGGTFYSGEGSKLLLQNSTVAASLATTGGGFYSERGTVTILINTNVRFNVATIGGGFYNQGELEIYESDIFSNTAFELGGGIANDGLLFLYETNANTNSAGLRGGALYQGVEENSLASFFIRRTRLKNNRATENGGAIQQVMGEGRIEGSCIEGNSDIAINRVGGAEIEAPDNWWGSPNGPSNDGSGPGDSISEEVNDDPSLKISNCSVPLRLSLPQIQRADNSGK